MDSTFRGFIDAAAHMATASPYCLSDTLQPPPPGHPAAATGAEVVEPFPAAGVAATAVAAGARHLALQVEPSSELLCQMGFDGRAPLASLAPDRSVELLDCGSSSGGGGDLSEFLEGAFLADGQALQQAAGQAWV